MDKLAGSHTSIKFILSIIFGISFTVAVIFALLFGGLLPVQYLWFAALIWFGITIIICWLVSDGIQLRRKQLGLQMLMKDLESRQPEIQQRIENVMQISHAMIDAVDESDVINQTLASLRDMAGASAGSFVLLDEWGRPLSTFTNSDLPAPLIKAWAEHLATESVRQKCEICLSDDRNLNHACPQLQTPFSDVLNVYCLQAWRGDRLLGIFNFYFPAKSQFPQEIRPIIGSMINEMAYALMALRLRNQEMNTLRQLQMIHSPQSDLYSLMGNLLESARYTLEADYVLLDIKALGEWQSGLRVERGSLEESERMSIQEACDLVLRQGETSQTTSGEASIIAVPIYLQGSHVSGVFLAVSTHGGPCSDQDDPVIASVATQFTQLLINQRNYLEREFKIVMQERGRLAREIHDGLAQTIAFLKMQTSQMKTYLNRGENSRLRQTLEQNYQILSDAYVDVRQVIDNLRLSPQPRMLHWIEQIVNEFEHHTGLKVERSYQVSDLTLAPEVQAQLIRILQEALNNIRKHAHAERVWVTFRRWDDDLLLEIGDNGQGFSSDDLSEVSKYGLRGMRERSELIGADFQVTSQPNDGTVIHICLPIVGEETNR